MKLLIIISFLGLTLGQYTVPDALVEVFRPRGLRVSIPDEEGIKLFAFHAKVNEEMNGREGGTFSRDITKAKNGRWTFYDPTAQLKVGDTIYYWTYVDYFDGKNKLGYTNDDQTFVVTELLEKDSKAPTGTTNPPPVTFNPEPEKVSLPSGCTASVTTLNNRRVCAGEQIFEENFTTLRESHWSPEFKFADKPDFEFVWYSNRKENLKVEKGHLEIRPIPTDELYGEGFVTSKEEINLGTNCTGILGTDECVQTPNAFLILPPVISAQITTKNKWAFKYGRVEIRAKLPKGDWIYPELYLNPQNEDYGPGYQSGQIRIGFVQGNNDLSRNLQAGCILGTTTAARNFAMKTIRKNSDLWTDAFHTYTLIWKPDQITVRVDDQVFGQIYAPHNGFASLSHILNLQNADRWHTGTKFAPFDKEMYLAIGVGVGGHSFQDRSDGTKPWVNNDGKGEKNFYRAKSHWKPTWTDSSLQVDYVKIWAL